MREKMGEGYDFREEEFIPPGQHEIKAKELEAQENQKFREELLSKEKEISEESPLTRLSEGKISKRIDEAFEEIVELNLNLRICALVTISPEERKELIESNRGKIKKLDSSLELEENEDKKYAIRRSIKVLEQNNKIFIALEQGRRLLW